MRSPDDLRRAAPLFSSIWLFDVLPRALRTDPPTVLNSDGDEVVFHTLNFSVAAAAAPEEIERPLGSGEQAIPLANSELAVRLRRHLFCGPRFTDIENGSPQLADARPDGTGEVGRPASSLPPAVVREAFGLCEGGLTGAVMA